MKKLLLTIAIAGLAVCTQAQGLIGFNNRAVGVTARIFGTDGTSPLLGTGFYAQLYAADGVVTDVNLLAAKGTPVSFGTTASASGYVLTAGTYPSGGAINPNVAVSAAPGVVTLAVFAWAADTTTTTYANSSAKAHSALFQLTSVTSPATPPNLVGLQGFHLVGVPEPTTVALGVMGLSVLLFRRRK